MHDGRKMVIWKTLLVFVFVLGTVEADIFGGLFGKQKKDGQGGGAKVEHPGVEDGLRYKDYLPLYWKDFDCEPAPDTERYLLMSKRNGGWNNERMIIENALVMAWLTNRTLVIPKSLRYDHMHGQENFEKFLNLRYARCFVPIVTSDILPKISDGKIDEKYAGAEDYSDAFSFYIEYNNQVFAYPEVPTAQGPDLDDFNNFRATRGIANQLAPTDGTSIVPRMKVEKFENSARIINSKKPFFSLFYTFYWFQDKAKHDQMIDLIKHGAHYHEHFFDDAYKILRTLGPPGTFSTIHIRARDFRTQTGYYSHFKMKNWIDAMKTLHSNTFHRGELVYISTDEKNMTDIQTFQKDLLNELGVPSVTIYDFLERFSLDPNLKDRRWEFWGKKKVAVEEAAKFNLNDLGAVEQIICAHGRRFIGTFFSTFSAHIVRLRGYLPFKTVKDDEHLFWDRSLPFETSCGQKSAPESCEASWAGSLKGSLWATEFEEGWLHYGELKGRRLNRKLSPPVEKQGPLQVPVADRADRPKDNEKKDWLSKRIENRLSSTGHKKLREHHGEREKSGADASISKVEETMANAKRAPATKARKAFLETLKSKVKAQD